MCVCVCVCVCARVCVCVHVHVCAYATCVGALVPALVYGAPLWAQQVLLMLATVLGWDLGVEQGGRGEAPGNLPRSSLFSHPPNFILPIPGNP